MALRFFDGFDFWSQNEIPQRWASFSAVTSDTNGTGRYTGKSFRLAGGIMKKTIDAQGTWTFGCAIQLQTFTSQTYLLVLYNGSTIYAAVQLGANNKLQLVVTNSSGVATVFGTGTTPLSLNVWYYIELHVVAASIMGNVVAEIRLNGVSEVSFAGGQSGTYGSSTSGTTANIVAIYNSSNTVNFYDDFYACDGTSGINNTFLGDVRVDTVSPTAAGNYTQWTPSAGNNWDCVDETTPNSDTDYVSTNASNIDTYVTGDLTSTPMTIYGVQSNIWARRDDAGPHILHTLVRISSTDYESGDFTVTSSYAYYTNMMETSPATSSAWTASEINGMEAGFKFVS